VADVKNLSTVDISSTVSYADGDTQLGCSEVRLYYSQMIENCKRVYACIKVRMLLLTHEIEHNQ
jgi:hypothetical protein